MEQLLNREPGVPTFQMEAETGDESLSNLVSKNSPLFWLQQTYGLSAFDLEVVAISQTAPQAYRQGEQSQLSQAESAAAATAQEKLQGMHGERSQSLEQVTGKQVDGKGKDEQSRAKIAGDIDKIYQTTKTKVDDRLAKLTTAYPMRLMRVQRRRGRYLRNMLANGCTIISQRVIPRVGAIHLAGQNGLMINYGECQTR